MAEREKLKPVTITWKENEKDLHDFVWDDHSSASSFIKDVLRKEMNGENAQNNSQSKPNNKSVNPDLFKFLD